MARDYDTTWSSYHLVITVVSCGLGPFSPFLDQTQTVRLDKGVDDLRASQAYRLDYFPYPRPTTL